MSAEDRYYKDDEGNFVLDKRNTNNMDDMREDLYKLIASVESMKVNVDTSLKAVYDKISNLDEKIGNKLQIIERKVDDTVNEQLDISDKLKAHEQEIMNSKKYFDDLQKMKVDYEALKAELVDVKKDVSDLKIAPTKKKAGWIDDLLNSLRTAAFTAISAGVIGFLAYLLWGYAKAKVGN